MTYLCDLRLSEIFKCTPHLILIHEAHPVSYEETVYKNSLLYMSTAAPVPILQTYAFKTFLILKLVTALTTHKIRWASITTLIDQLLRY